MQIKTDRPGNQNEVYALGKTFKVRNFKPRIVGSRKFKSSTIYCKVIRIRGELYWAHVEVETSGRRKIINLWAMGRGQAN